MGLPKLGQGYDRMFMGRLTYGYPPDGAMAFHLHA
jgi:hypothetical protein